MIAEPEGIWVGDVLDIIATWPEKFIHLCVSSPPYWSLRDYKVKPKLWPEIRFRLNEWSPETVVPEMLCCLGLEPDPVAFVGHLLHIYRQIRRCLRDDALVFVNLGDSFCKSGGKGGGNSGRPGRSFKQSNIETKPPQGLKAKDLLAVPWLFAMAMRADGWYFRGDSVWCKRSPMPETIGGTHWKRCMVKIGREPVDWKLAPKGWQQGTGAHDKIPNGNYRTNVEEEQTKVVWGPCPGCKKCEANDGYVLRRGGWRHTRAHEYVFQFSKSATCFSDEMAVAEPASGGAHSRGAGLNPKAAGNERTDENRDKQNGSFATAVNDLVLTRNPRSFYLLSTEPSKEKHFAAYPKKLILPFIKAGTSAGGYCSNCGAPVCRIIERVRVPTRPGLNPKGDWKADNFDETQQRSSVSPNRDPQRHITEKRTVGWRKSCQCTWGETKQAIVFDPFGGTGTTAVVAKSLGLRYLLTELNPQYAEIAARKIENAVPHAEQVESRPRKKAKASTEQLDLF